MKKSKLLSVVLFVVIAACVLLGSVITSSAKTDFDNNGVAAVKVDSRIENMLNSNRIYDGMFSSDSLLIEEAAIALSDRQNNGYVSTELINNYLTAMYSVNVSFDNYDYQGVKAVEGYIPLPCRGYTDYSHIITKVLDNGDGTVTVLSDITLDYHDGKPETKKCETLFCVNSDSPFGYNIVYSYIAK